jgi:muconate cycloisomerase
MSNCDQVLDKERQNMLTLRARLYQLSIPFKMTFSHAGASRAACDSLILEISDGDYKGYGELVLRSYVNDPAGVLNSFKKISVRIEEILNLITGNYSELPDIEQLKQVAMLPQWAKQDLPLFAAAETALLDLLCRKQDIDIYTLLKLSPVREELTYGGILPLLSDSAMKKMLTAYKQMAIPYMRIKLSKEYSLNLQILKTARISLGNDFDIRVDVNCAWDTGTALRHIDLLNKYNIKMVEEPLVLNRREMIMLAEQTKGSGIIYVADESAVTFEDLENIITDKTFGMLNIRIAKNGGIIRTLELADRAQQAGLYYQLGCHVGETGILSAAGRTAASLMKNPLYIDGSFDDFILSENITKQSYTFGHAGKASAVHGKHMGYDVYEEKLGNGTALIQKTGKVS